MNGSMTTNPRGLTHPIAVAVLALPLTLAAGARAGESDSERYALAWSRADEASDCPDREALVGALRERLGREPFLAEGQRVVFVELSRQGSTRSATLHVTDRAGGDLGGQVITSPSADCAELFDASVAALTAMLGSASDPTPRTAGTPPPAEPAAAADASGPPAEPAPRADPPAPRPSAKPPPGPAPSSRRRPTPPNLLGLELALDMTIFGHAKPVCSSGSAFDCYTTDGEEYAGAAASELGNQVNGGATFGAGRALVDYHRLVTQHLGLEARAGVAAINRAKEALPVHLELGVRYWAGTGKARGRAFFGASVGVAAFDGTVRTEVEDCATEASPSGDPDCLAGSRPGAGLTVDAVRRTGSVFAGVAAGGLVKFGPGGGLLLRNSFYFTFPNAAFVLLPSVGYVRTW